MDISIVPNGPYKVEGNCTLLGPDGAPLETREGKAIWLCRCGASSNKPFCDGTHNRIEFAPDSPADPNDDAGA